MLMSVCLCVHLWLSVCEQSQELRVQSFPDFWRMRHATCGHGLDGPPLAALRYVMYYFRFHEWRHVCAQRPEVGDTQRRVLAQSDSAWRCMIVHWKWPTRGITGAGAESVIFHLRRSDHITDALVSLHWLRVPERIQFKIAVLTYRVPHGNAPRYLGPLTSTVDVPGRRALRSAGTNRLVVPPVRLVTVDSRAFFAAAHTWNSLPEHTVSASTLQSFKRHLKTLLLQHSSV